MTGNINEAFLIKRYKAKLTLTYKSTTIKKCMTFKIRKHITHPYFSKIFVIPLLQNHTSNHFRIMTQKSRAVFFQNCDVRKLFKSKVSHNTISHNAEIARDTNLIHFRIMTKKTPYFLRKIFRQKL